MVMMSPALYVLPFSYDTQATTTTTGANTVDSSFDLKRLDLQTLMRMNIGNGFGRRPMASATSMVNVGTMALMLVV